MVLFAQAFVFHPKSPVRIPLGKSAVGSDLVHLLVIAHLENDGEEIETVGFGLLTNLLLGSEELGRK